MTELCATCKYFEVYVCPILENTQGKCICHPKAIEKNKIDWCGEWEQGYYD